MTKEELEELKRLLYTDNITQYGKRKLINYYEQQIQTQQEEIEKKDKLYKKAIKGLIKANKIINLMANELIKNNIHKKYCYYVAGSTECSHNCRECIKEIAGGKQC